MRVLLLSQYFFPEVGATQTRMYQFAKTLAELGHTVDVLTEFPNHPTGVIPDSYRGRWLEYDGSHPFRIVRVRVFASPHKTFLTRIAFYFSYCAMAVVASFALPRRYEVVAATSPPLPVALAGVMIAWAKRSAFVMDVRDLWPKAAKALRELSNPALYRCAERAERFLYRRAARITATTKSFCRYIAGCDPAFAAKTRLVPNGTLEDIFSPARGDNGIKRQLGLESAFVIVYAGLHGIAQDLDTAIDAASRLKASGVQFVFVGEGPRKAHLVAAAAARGADNVRFLPQVRLEDSCFYMNAADAVLVPLAADPVFDMFVPSKLFDAMSCARPVILSVDGEARDILAEAGAGVFAEPGDSRALADAVLALRDDPAGRSEMGRRGREFVLRHYRRTEQAVRFAEILSEAAAR
jgi:glycosyltransferase involved in cell wall biosynthesis